MNNIDAPYFMRYLYKMRFLESQSKFNQFKGELAKTSRSKIEMTYGDNWLGRQIAIEDKIDFTRSIIDVGCGEGKYITRFASKAKRLNYYAIDINEEELEQAKRRVKNKRMENVQFFNSLDELVDADVLDSNDNEKGFDVILTEVIEHMPVEDAKKLLIDIINIDNVRRIIITTPDVRFNKNYFISEDRNGMRHDDHDWEPNKDEFINFITDSLNGSDKFGDTSYDWFAIGDNVDGVTPTQGCVIDIHKETK